MDMSFDFTKPTLTVVEKSLKGKTFFIYGTNRTGKTANAVKFPRPFAVAFEQGLNAIAGLPHIVPKKWSDTKKIVKQFSREEVRELYDTIIIDTADKMGSMLIKRICSDHDVEQIGDANNGFGAYGDINKLLAEFLDPLTKLGYTIIIIGHDTVKQVPDPQTGEKYDRTVPRGDKRVIAEICDLVDIIGCAQPQGFDEEGNEINSKIYLKDAKYFKSGSRWKKIVPWVEFTVENLTKAVIDAIEAEETEENKEHFVEQKTHELDEKIDLASLKGEIKTLMDKSKELSGSYVKAKELCELSLGEGVKVSQASERQVELLLEIKDNLIEFNKNLKNGTVSLDTED